MELRDIHQYYDKAAPYYDILTDIVFKYGLGLEKYRSKMVDMLGDIKGAKVLDIGCGTGRNFPLLVDKVGKSGLIIGLDYSEGMLARADRLIRKNGWENVKVIRGDAATLDNVDPPFDAVVSAWCLGIVYDLNAALQRALGVLKPGGSIALMDFQVARPEYGPMRWFFPVYSRLLQWVGIDTAEDLDNEHVKTKWNRGQAFLESHLVDVYKEFYLYDSGFLMKGKLPKP